MYAPLIKEGDRQANGEERGRERDGDGATVA